VRAKHNQVGPPLTRVVYDHDLWKSFFDSRRYFIAGITQGLSCALYNFAAQFHLFISDFLEFGGHIQDPGHS